MLTPEQTIAEEAARAGGAIAARYFREGVTMRNKDVANLVSDADIEAEHAIAAVIRKAFPSHAILGEEAYQGDVTAEHLWVVDPIDGTNNFAHQIPHFAVSVAYYHNGEAALRGDLQPDPRRVAFRRKRARGFPRREESGGGRGHQTRRGSGRGRASTTTEGR